MLFYTTELLVCTIQVSFMMLGEKIIYILNDCNSNGTHLHYLGISKYADVLSLLKGSNWFASIFKATA